MEKEKCFKDLGNIRHLVVAGLSFGKLRGASADSSLNLAQHFLMIRSSDWFVFFSYLG